MILLAAMVLDAVFGEPEAIWRRLTHPAILMGRAVGWSDTRFNHGPARRLKGTFAIVILTSVTFAIGWLLSLWWLTELLTIAILLAQRSLVDHVQAVATALREGTDQGRKAVAMIVGRDTRDMDQSATSRAAIESAAENFSDGVLAPLFWALIGGLPALAAYKMINSADSMIGYRTPRHEAFGWAAARLDDAVNLIPARLSALLLAPWPTDWRAITQDARSHRSPNAGWPEAAMARALDISLAGPRSYEGQTKPFPFVNHGARAPGARDIEAATRRLWRAWGIALAAVGLLALI
ncbi:MAG: adenosylcobinamide-phosphate synthase CbiB [Shimia sp.]